MDKHQDEFMSIECTVSVHDSSPCNYSHQNIELHYSSFDLHILHFIFITVFSVYGVLSFNCMTCFPVLWLSHTQP